MQYKQNKQNKKNKQTIQLCLLVVIEICLIAPTFAFIATLRQDFSSFCQISMTKLPQEESDKLATFKNSTLGVNVRRAFLASSALAGLQLVVAQAYAPSGFKRIPTQFIAALSDPKSNSGVGEFGLWRDDPGPRGVWIDQFDTKLRNRNNFAPAGWTFDPNDWWVEEHGLIMSSPQFPIQKGKYLVTGGRETTTVLEVGIPTFYPNGTTTQSYKLEDPKATIYDVTHLPCRSARYTPIDGSVLLPPNQAATMSDFPVKPGSAMPNMKGYKKQDYAVLFVIGVEESLAGDLPLGLEF